MEIKRLAWLRYFAIMNGDQYVMIFGPMKMQKWPVDNWDSCLMVCILLHLYNITCSQIQHVIQMYSQLKFAYFVRQYACLQIEPIKGILDSIV